MDLMFVISLIPFCHFVRERERKKKHKLKLYIFRLFLYSEVLNNSYCQRKAYSYWFCIENINKYKQSISSQLPTLSRNIRDRCHLTCDTDLKCLLSTAKQGDNALGIVCPSICLSACLSMLSWLNPKVLSKRGPLPVSGFLCVCVTT